jgi:hypothetical protein
MKVLFHKHSGETLETKLNTTLERAGFALGNSDVAGAIQYVSISGKASSEQEEFFSKGKNDSEIIENFRSFIWMPSTIDYTKADEKQKSFIERIQRELTPNMILSRAPSAIQFVEEVRQVLEQQAKKIYDTKPTDIFLICNETDEKDAKRIQSLLSGIVKMEKLVIVQDTGIDYEEFASQQMNVSRLSVVYYKGAVEWALPFAQQIWKKVGGAAAKSPILFISDTSAGTNNVREFNAPNVSCFAMSSELIPLEIKVQFDSLSE